MDENEQKENENQITTRKKDCVQEKNCVQENFIAD